jgi:hypothetical protein
MRSVVIAIGCLGLAACARDADDGVADAALDGGTDAAPGGRTDAAPGGRTDAAPDAAPDGGGGTLCADCDECDCDDGTVLTDGLCAPADQIPEGLCHLDRDPAQPDYSTPEGCAAACAELQRRAEPPPACDCGPDEVCVQFFDGTCETTGPRCVPRPAECPETRCDDACDLALCHREPSTCRVEDACGGETTGAFNCYGP